MTMPIQGRDRATIVHSDTVYLAKDRATRVAPMSVAHVCRHDEGR